VVGPAVTQGFIKRLFIDRQFIERQFYRMTLYRTDNLLNRLFFELYHSSGVLNAHIQCNDFYEWTNIVNGIRKAFYVNISITFINYNTRLTYYLKVQIVCSCSKLLLVKDCVQTAPS